MRILMLTPYLPYPPSSGGQIRSYNLIKKLSKKHQIVLYSLIKNESERKYIQNLKEYCQDVKVFNRPSRPWTLTNILNTGFSRYPFLVIRNFSSEEKKSVSETLATEQFDIIHAETFYVSPHIPETKIPIVLVDQTIEYQVYQHFVQNFKYKVIKPILNIDVLKIKFWETYYWRRASRVVAVSSKDAQLMTQLVPDLKVKVIPNGVGEDLIGKTNLHYSKKILFMANYAWLQNIEAAKILAEKIFPEVLKHIKDAELVIAGQNTDKINILPQDKIKIINLGIEDIEGVKKCYQECGVLVAPLYGPGGTRLKILGAMAAKLPVVTTSIGLGGIENSQDAAMIGETPGELANLTVKLLEDKKLYQRIAENARKLVEEKYTYQVIAKELDDLYQEVKDEKKTI